MTLSRKPKATTRLLGHLFGVVGVVTGINAIAATINPPDLQPISLEAAALQQAAAVLISIGLVALGLWLVTSRARGAKPGTDPRKLR